MKLGTSKIVVMFETLKLDDKLPNIYSLVVCFAGAEEPPPPPHPASAKAEIKHPSMVFTENFIRCLL